MILDLHGKSLRAAREAVDSFIKKALDDKVKSIIIITGRGNHPNQDGRRGLIFKALPTWLKKPHLQPLIELVRQELGSYKIFFKTEGNDLVETSRIIRIFKKLSPCLLEDKF